MTYVGIDVSKATFVVAYSSAKSSETKTFKNTTKGIREFIRTISPEENHCVLEATGNYSMLLVYLLSKAGFTVSMENPLKIKNFARVMLSVVKTDEIDARLIALYGERMQPAPFKLRSDSLLLLKQKRTVLRQLKKQLTANRNLEGSLKVLPFIDSKCKKVLEKTTKFLEKQIQEMEEELTSLAEIEYKKQMDLLTSIKGIGATLAAALIIATGGFTYFDNAKQLTRYLGCHLLINSLVRQSMSKGTLIVTEMLTYVVSFILELWHHCGATKNAKHALTACDQMESLERSLLSLLPTNLSDKPSLLLHMRRNI